MERWAERATTVRVVGTGIMGRGIAQVAAAAGLTVQLADARPEAVGEAVAQIGGMFGKLAAKGRMSAEDAAAAEARLVPLDDPLAPGDGLDLVVEAVREDLATKQRLLQGLENVCPESTVFATNTSSLSVTRIAAGMSDPSRLAGLHFFNPVPLMKLAEVIPGARTAAWIPDALTELVRRFGHTPVRAPDTPGFLVNHAGRGLSTEALQIVAEGTARPVDVDRIARDVLGLKMGPFELMDLTGLDVSHPVLETIWEGFHYDDRLRPSDLTRARYDAGLFGRKVGEGWYRYEDGVKQEPAEAAPSVVTGSTTSVVTGNTASVVTGNTANADPLPPFWITGPAPDADRLAAVLAKAGVPVERGPFPSEAAIVLDTDGVVFPHENALDPRRTVAVDPTGGFERRLVLTVHPGLDVAVGKAALAGLAATGLPVTVVGDAPVPVSERLLASIVNVSCEIAQRGLASPADIDTAVRLGLGYPFGPLEWGDRAGGERVLSALSAMFAGTGDPRYRPSRWLAHRVALGMPLTVQGTTPADFA
ncbi:3-hydroxyacyl-CoA dehydrogenase [Actinomadura rupiterrae]|uniref:3-hydroxyacyl-CoA dehydrogenase n=1 Tax=Actinomadura rupiterrae TaxID=559627 RepID=UPI0020A2CB7A|nr:3-hydroxyacyl-CoA dehydrogenase [Actinomadura rupiterrae]MCP2337755.1 3-hydroxybutyryl-CoA dehydrogenase [Actinomadura rupiterrae]